METCNRTEWVHKSMHSWLYQAPLFIGWKTVLSLAEFGMPGSFNIQECLSALVSQNWWDKTQYLISLSP